MKKLLTAVCTLLLISIGAYVTGNSPIDLLSHHQNTTAAEENSTSYDQKIYFPADKYPETAKHIKTAIKEGHSKICTIDRDGADENREESLKDVPTKKGYDRDEWPMAMCQEGGAGADIEYIEPSDNRGAGSWVSHQLDDFPDGTRVLFVVK
ncbi:NucA/NucB deoxyribonuclease domain-containing protein [Bacillus velezensis]|uniref:NucA/NucB deoxyribonuclease domain-containing protein n=1 Tax=Bacillus TaxID=1386 RepID=UPI000313D71A|nr:MULTISPECIES: NucA/NucB deoxyribonuclease domain-containing protein [Bacillus]AYC54124.1 sporulation protein [Bacillus licheniformis]MCT6515477.1 NucA/NucB deoxyribonuclease domain-containing protein [Bacillus subtilis]MCY7773443.1 NucA/NucB deoxyribonuclease domain-containing protein [Bacillus licheniformis]MCY7780155.1 NucA/NucB deoxyribonuclease domain-containing protein [Bacillus haynesii]MCY8021533.1 NucA/NucB deoxyribonuclease domain-containing protein [Bacillus licheniformis]